MNAAALDLNLLFVFQALMQHRSVTRAGLQLGLSQPAVSSGLARLRHHYKDPLFVRQPTGMEPTARALEIAEPLATALAQIQGTLSTGEDFSPPTAEHKFRIGLVNFGGVFFVPSLMNHVEREAPKVSLHFDVVTELELGAMLNGGSIDVAVGVFEKLQGSWLKKTIFHEKSVVIARHGNPAVGESMSFDEFVALRQVDIKGYNAVDRCLADMGARRRISVVAPNVVMLPHMVARSNLIAVCSEGIARVFRKSCDLQIFELPFEMPSYTVDLVWHEKQKNDSVHQWLRASVAINAESVNATLDRPDLPESPWPAESNWP